MPQIITQPSDKTLVVNNDTTNIQLHCMANETVSYEWEKQSGSIPSDAEGIKTNTLILISITPNDSGNYRCIAINKHGRNYSNYATINITGKSAKYVL